MFTRYIYILVSVVLALFIALVIALFVFGFSLQELLLDAKENVYLTAAVFTFLMFFATVAAPFTSAPVIPIAASILHPAVVALLSIIGWTVGSVVAFLIARHYGKPFLGRFMSVKKIEEYERQVPERIGFFTLVLMRMAVPVDVLSYAIGLVSNMRLSVYTLATLIGVAPFSFVFAYGGAAFFSKNFLLVGAIIIIGAMLFGGAWYVLKRRNDTL